MVTWSTIDINLPNWEVLEAVVPQTFISVAIFGSSRSCCHCHRLSEAAPTLPSLSCLEGWQEHGSKQHQGTVSILGLEKCVYNHNPKGRMNKLMWKPVTKSFWKRGFRLFWKGYPLLVGTRCLKEKARGHLVYSFTCVASCIKKSPAQLLLAGRSELPQQVIDSRKDSSALSEGVPGVRLISG